MIIYRFEHKRALCDHFEYREGGISKTGHGPHFSCGTSLFDLRPNFGGCGSPPRFIAQYERCAVTHEQFKRWISPIRQCSRTTQYCYGESYCCYCPARLVVNCHETWELVMYNVDDSKEGIDWREDNDQIVFNPEFAKRLGTISVDAFNMHLDNAVTA